MNCQQPLNEQEINAQLAKKGFTTPYQLHLFSSINSTNTYLKNLGESELLDICCAEAQTQGKGRFGRQWNSPFGENIYCSSRWNLDADLGKLSGLSLISSLAVLATIKELNPDSDIQVKWPNDLLWQGKKLCGSLIEISTDSQQTAQVIIGIGLNVNSDTKNNQLADRPNCSLFEIFNQYFDRNLLIANIISTLDAYLNRFMQNGLEDFLDEWRQYDYLLHKQISVQQSVTTIAGIARGINELGQLILEEPSGLIHLLNSGDTSLA